MSELDRHVRAVRAVRAGAEQARRDLADASPHRRTRSLRALADQLVTTLVPMFEAEESVICRVVGAELRDGLKADHHDLRGLTERLSILSENAESNHRRLPDRKPVASALHETITALDSLERHHLEASALLDRMLSPADRDELELALLTATMAAREHTVLIVQPPVPPDESVVLRHRPDLDSAHVTTVAALDQGPSPGSSRR